MGSRHRANQIYGGDKASSEYLASGQGLVNISERSRAQLEKLLSLEEKKVDQYALMVELNPILLPPGKLFSGKTYFSVYLKDDYGRLSERPVVDRALYSVGGKGVLPWIEIGYYWDEVILKKEGTIPETIHMGDSGTEYALFKLLGDFIPPGGHMMVPYELDDNLLSRRTSRALQKNIPMVATPIGFLLFRMGFTIPFRDWYIAEGGHEGPRKLQFEKPLSHDREREVFGEIMDELGVFLDGSREADDVDLIKRCKGKALKVRDMIFEGM